ncbi:4-alpha-glucanotransferase [Alkaliphilus pronyensis]|uniref:4-alpha-glucanotransferase n=1 Tax=Alkaliphilus pronyensis TaxID=1482732 RepID=A0A6I0F890_9FIRM|nr:4-alpha-glucanotransferase [Alkaliphilus pronyensis]KAB3534099.1 4-alpha-glucanotransferase [Alkaliphilus pronyensis]
MKLIRQCGILLHPTSLPSKYGIGDMGKEAYQFVDFLKRANQKLWQVLPLNPPGYGESPYQCFSAFAGNPLIISIDLLLEDGYLEYNDIEAVPSFSESKVEFQKVKEYKDIIFKKAFNSFKKLKKDDSYFRFIEDNKNWLHDYGLFMAIKDHSNGRPWNKWHHSIAFPTEEVKSKYKHQLKDEVQYYIFLQYLFDKQWRSLRDYSNKQGIKIIGDLPIFISYDSSDAWTHPHLFELDDKGNPLKVAGVPPDCFSKTGQLWGNPHFKWSVMESNGFQWWKNRFKKLIELVDIIRIDHFRGFEAYWVVSATAKTAEAGSWVKAPGQKLFSEVKKELESLPIIVEDLGFITPEVKRLKKQFNFPGMKILQFSFGRNVPRRERPAGYEKASVVYTGTHDNETILGWYKNIIASNNKYMLKILNKHYGINPSMKDEEICWRFIEIAYNNSSSYAIIPLQDIIVLDNTGRMNYPGTVGGNWDWRYEKRLLTADIEDKLRKLTEAYNR